MPRSLTSLALVIVVLGIGWGAQRYVVESRPIPPTLPPRVLAPVPVEFRELRLQTAQVVVRSFGTFMEARRARLAAEVPGRLVSVYPDWRVGAAVAEGEILFVVDTKELGLERTRAEGAVELAKAEIERAEAAAGAAASALVVEKKRMTNLEREEARWVQLYEKGDATEGKVDTARLALIAAERILVDTEAAQTSARLQKKSAVLALREAEAARDLAGERIAKATVRAPFAGHLVGPAPALGTTVVHGQGVAELVDVSVLHLTLPVPAGDAAFLGPGRVARVTVPSRPGLELEGRVASVGVVADIATRTIPVEVDIANGPGPGPERDPERAGTMLAVGQFAEAAIEAETLKDVLLVARDHVVWRGGRATCYIVLERGRETVAEEREVELGRAVGDALVVKRGLLAGEQLITAPLDRLTDGAPIEPGDFPKSNQEDGDRR